MSNQEKVITFTFKVDEQTLGRLKNEIRDITSAMQKLVQVASGIGTGGRGGPVAVGGGGTFSNQGTNAAIKTQAQQGPGAGLASAFVEAGKSMKDMANISKDSLRVMSDGVRRAIDEQKRSLEGLDRDIKKIIEDYDRLAQAKDALSPEPGGKGPGTLAHGYQQMMDEQQQKLLKAQVARNVSAGQLGTLQQQWGQMMSAQIPGGGGGGGGIGGAIQGAMGAVPGFLPRNAGGGVSKMAALAAVLGVANFGLDEYMAGTRFEASAGARRAGVVTGQMQALRGGDYRMLYAARTLDAEAQRQLEAQTSGFGANAEVVRSGIGQVVGSVPLIGGVARKLGVVGEDTGGGVLGGFTTPTQQTQMAQNALEQIKARAEAQILEGMAMQQFQGTLGSRIAAQRMLGIGGLGSTRTRRAKTGKGTVTESADPFAELSYRLSRQGYDIGDYISGVAGLRMGAGSQFAGQFGWEAMAAGATGMGGYSEMLAASARAGNAGNVFARTAVGGGIDRYAGVQLGQAIIGQGFDPMGTTTGMGLLGAAQLGMGFTGGTEDFRRVQQVQAGMGLGNALLSGQMDPYQKGLNLVSAMRIKPEADVYAQDYLAGGMNMRQMADVIRTGKPTDLMEAYGVSVGDVREQFGAVSESFLARAPSMSTSTPGGAALAAFRASGQDLPAYLHGLKGDDRKNAIRMLGSVLGDITGYGPEAGIGFVGTSAGLDSKEMVRQGLIGKGLTGVEKIDQEARAETEKKIADELLRIHKTLGDVAKEAPKDFTRLLEFGTNLDASADRFIKALSRMADVMEAKFGTSTPTPKPPPPKAAAPSAGTPTSSAEVTALPGGGFAYDPNNPYQGR